MNCKFINVLMFAAGAAIGSAVTWKVVKAKYEKIVQEEIKSIKEAFGDQQTHDQEQDEHDAEDEDVEQISWDDLEDLNEGADENCLDDDMDEYALLASIYAEENEEKGGAIAMAKPPYVISPYDFGELDDYKKFELTYYSDGVLEDEDYAIVTDHEELIGPDALNTFGEYEDDAVFVRNEKLCADFQILKDYRSYEEARSVGPKQVDDE